MQQRTNQRGTSAALLLALVIGACSSFNKPATAPSIDPNIYPTNYRAIIADFMRTYLSDPRKVRDALVSVPVLRPVGGTVHYISCVRYNPRGGGGQYLGSRDRVAIFWAGRLNQFLPAKPELCADANYQPFPEAEALVP